MKKTIAWCLLLMLSGMPTWAEPLELPRRLSSLDGALAAVKNVGAVREPPLPTRRGTQWQSGDRVLGEPPLRVDSPKKQRSRKKLYLSAALAVGAGAVAYWSKERADAAYNRYLRSASAERQQRELDEAKRFDRVTGAAFVSMEVGLVLSSYLLFFRSRS